jgi:hypothetical protein
MGALDLGIMVKQYVNGKADVECLLIQTKNIIKFAEELIKASKAKKP